MRAGITAIVFIGNLGLLVFLIHRYPVLDDWIEWPMMETRVIHPERYPTISDGSPREAEMTYFMGSLLRWSYRALNIMVIEYLPV